MDMRTRKELAESPEMDILIERAKYIKSFGTNFEYRLNRKQPEGKIVKLTKTILDINNEDNIEIMVKYFLKLTDLYSYLTKGSQTQNETMEIRVLKTPYVFKDTKFRYETEFVDGDKFGTRLYKIDLDDLDTGSISFWLDEHDNIYRKIEAQDRFELRKWQYNAAGNKAIVIKGKTLSFDTIISRKTGKVELI
jgi:hypothetical protein